MLRMDGWRIALLAAFAAFLQAPSAYADGLKVVYPSPGHVTTAERIFFIGTANPGEAVWLNGRAVHRSSGGHFAPSAPLAVGRNEFHFVHRGESLRLSVVRKPLVSSVPQGAAFAPGTIEPASDRVVQPGEPIRFSAVAAPGAVVTVHVGGKTVPLLPQPPAAVLPDNKAGLVGAVEPKRVKQVSYAGAIRFSAPGRLGKPIFGITVGTQRHQEMGPGALEVALPDNPKVIQVTAEEAVTRSGPSTDFSRLTPLPRGVRAAVTGQVGEWLRLSYGAWVNRSEVAELPGALVPTTLVRSVRLRSTPGATEISWPLQQAVPFTVELSEGSLTLNLQHALAQTDIIRTDDDPLVRRLEWNQTAPEQVAYRLVLKQPQPGGFTARYEGTTLTLRLKHAPPPPKEPGRLEGVRIVLDPGHGGAGDTGTRGPTGLREKDLTLPVTRRLKEALERRGARVWLTRDGDVDVGLKARTDQIASLAPDLSLSIHYNALPDAGNAEMTRGFGAFWYHPQAHALARSIHDRITKGLGRPSYGIWWDNLALARPTVAPSVLLELGFLTNPEEFEWCTDEKEQGNLVEAIADGVGDWLAGPRT
ncbi:MAG: N-acetylmuramoyl-L-alanine amidase [Candidatus Sericytochromatia bacterium]|nr:N-acetylmuramoyl-L-alanine amidase [Candidatus Sericytochromatia bacterium]